jgi:hypothetical protein
VSLSPALALTLGIARKQEEKHIMDGLTLVILLALVFWIGWFSHWISARRQRRLLKRYRILFAELGDVIPARMPRQPGRRRKNGR